MKAVVLQEGHRFALQEVPKPVLQGSSEVMVRVTTAAICGSDLHIKHGMVPGVAPGTVIGHEFVGVIEEVGSGVGRFRVGDRVAAAAAVWCGACPACQRGDVQYCLNGGIWGGGELLGKGLAGAQTSLVRVPHADRCLTPVPDGVADEQAVFVGDVFSTGYHAAREGGIDTGDTVVVMGCGPIGLAALISAFQFGPKTVYAVDLFQNRLALASKYGAVAVDAGAGDVVERILEATEGQGADVVIEAIGNPVTFGQAVQCARRGGMVSVVGLFPAPVELPIHQLAFKGQRFSMGLGNLSRMDRLMGLLESGRVDLNPLVTHTFALDDAMAAYDLAEKHKDQCLKVLLKP